MNTSVASRTISAPVTTLSANQVAQRQFDRIADRSIVVMPDMLANTGGVTASYFEQVQSNTAHASRLRGWV